MASVAILDYEENIVLNTRVTTTRPIWSYVNRITGFTSKSLRNHRKDIEMKAEIQALVKDHVLIGHDLTADLKVLEIDKNQLCGIRDLSTAFVLRQMVDPNAARLSLKKVAEQLLGKPMRTEIRSGLNVAKHHSALEDVQTIAQIYKKIENDFIDDF